MDIDYSVGVKLDVNINSSFSNNIKGVLEVGSGIFPRLSIENRFTIEPQVNDFINYPPKIISCDAKGQVFTLLECDTSIGGVLPTYVVSGDLPDDIVGVDISLFGLYSFFNGYSSFEFKDSHLHKVIFENFANAKFSILEEGYGFSVEHFFSTRKEIDKTTITEDAVIRIKKDSGSLTVGECAEIVKKIRILFSLLLGYDISIRNTWLIFDEGNNRCPFYFHALSKSDKLFEYAHACLIVSPGLVDNNLWGVMLNKIFNLAFGKLISSFWVRLVNMFSYKGFWEYEILGVVSLLDAYSSGYHEKNALKKLPPEEFKTLKRGMASILQDHKTKLLNSEQPVSKDKIEVIESMVYSLDFIRNNNAPTFKVQFDFLLNSIDEDIRNLISFNNSDFKFIKEIRDLAAHGQPMGTEIIDNIQRAMIVKEKIKFLLIYIFFDLLGLSKSFFVSSCLNTHHRTKLGAMLDEFTRDKLSGECEFFEVSDEELRIATEIKSVDVCMIYHSRRKYLELKNDNIFTLEKEWVDSRVVGFNNKSEYYYSKYECSGYFGVNYVSKVYLLNAQRRVKFTAVTLIWQND